VRGIDSDESGSVCLSLCSSLMRTEMMDMNLSTEKEKDEYLEITPHASPADGDIEKFEYGASSCDDSEEWVDVDVNVAMDDIGDGLRVMNMGRFSVEHCCTNEE